MHSLPVPIEWHVNLPHAVYDSLEATSISAISGNDFDSDRFTSFAFRSAAYTCCIILQTAYIQMHIRMPHDTPLCSCAYSRLHSFVYTLYNDKESQLISAHNKAWQKLSRSPSLHHIPHCPTTISEWFRGLFTSACYSSTWVSGWHRMSSH